MSELGWLWELWLFMFTEINDEGVMVFDQWGMLPWPEEERDHAMDFMMRPVSWGGLGWDDTIIDNEMVM